MLKDEAILVVPTYRHAQSVRSMAEMMGCSSHLAIMVFYEFLREILRPGIDSKKKYYIDELDECLEAVGVLGYSNSVVEEK